MNSEAGATGPGARPDDSGSKGNGPDDTATAFDRAKAALQPFIDRFAEGDIDRPSVMAEAASVAREHKVPVIDARGWAKAAMDKVEVGKAGPGGAGAGGAPQPQHPPPFAVDPEPSERPASLGNLLDAVKKVISQRVFCSQEAADASSLWTVGTWGLFPPADPAAGPDIFPRLDITAPAKRCGKSTLLEIVATFARRSLMVTDISEAAVFRTVEKFRPTLFVDEADQVFRKSPSLVGAANSGYVRSGGVLRAEEVKIAGRRTYEPTFFSTFAAMALGGIGERPPTVVDRSIRIELQRRPAGKRARRVSLRKLVHMRGTVTPSLMAHADAIGAAMAKGVPDSIIAPSLNDRDADNWQPLLGLARAAGADWFARAERAANLLCRSGGDSDRGNESVLRQVVEFITEEHTDLIAAWRARLAAGPVVPEPSPPSLPFVASRDVANWLLNKDDSGFAECRDLGTVKQRLARALRTFGIRPTSRRVPDHQVVSVQRGYDVREVRGMWRSYRPPIIRKLEPSPLVRHPAPTVSVGSA